MQIKKYKALGYARLYTDVKVSKNRSERIFFSNGGFNDSIGMFTTSDEALQKAIESSSAYGKLYTLSESKSVDEENSNPIAGPGTGGPGAAELGDRQAAYIDTTKDAPVDEENSNPIEDESIIEFANFNSFRDYLVKEYNQSFSDVRSLSNAKIVAEKLGIKFKIEK